MVRILAVPESTETGAEDSDSGAEPLDNGGILRYCDYVRGAFVDKIFSARLDEAALDELERVTRKLKMTKRRFLEEAIHLRARQLEGSDSRDVWSETLGAWNRTQRPETSVAEAREAFRRGFERHQQGKRARVHR
jgi:hypothetical protein